MPKTDAETMGPITVATHGHVAREVFVPGFRRSFYLRFMHCSGKEPCRNSYCNLRARQRESDQGRATRQPEWAEGIRTSYRIGQTLSFWGWRLKPVQAAAHRRCCRIQGRGHAPGHGCADPEEDLHSARSAAAVRWQENEQHPIWRDGKASRHIGPWGQGGNFRRPWRGPRSGSPSGPAHLAQNPGQ